MIEIRVPPLPESVADATLVSWHKQPGESVGRDENLADLETDKVVLEVPAPANGVIREIRVQNGTTVTSGQLLAIIEEGAAAGKPAAPAQSNGTTQAAAVPAAPTPAAATDAGKLSPAVRRLVEENKLDAGRIPATGKDGRLTKTDVSGFIDKKPAAPAAKPAAAKAPTPAPAPRAPGARTEHRVAMTRLRSRIAERMVQAQSTQALLTTFNEVDLSAVQELRARYKDKFEKSQGVKLGFSSFFVKATVEALKKFPVVNASVDGADIVYHEFYDIGVAVSTERGLIVPVLRDADTLSFADIEKAIGNFAARAREGSITMEELTGGTFSITNGGVFGSLLSTPIVNSPQSAILGMHKILERPIAVDGQVVIRPMMNLAVTYDHRIIDGKEAVQFLVAIKEALEDPGRMLIGL
jgi:2-oxoglutarate dehydrogenase E2 component (dihydrolipoamide succinyltransferase)